MRTHDSSGFGTRLDALNRYKEFNKPRIQRVVSSKHKTHQKRRIQTQNAREEREDEYSAHIDDLNKISFINFRGIHLYKARAIRPSSYPLKLRD